MPQFAVLIYADDSAHAVDADPAALEEHGRHADDLEASGAMVLAYALTPRSEAVSVRRDATTAGPPTSRSARKPSRSTRPPDSNL